METRVCKVCGEEFPLTSEYFHLDHQKWFRLTCRECERVKHRDECKRYRERNRDRCKESARKAYYKFKECKPELFKEKNRKLHERRYPSLAEKRINEQREWYAEHKDEVDMRTEQRKEVRRLWKEDHPDEWDAYQEELREDKKRASRERMKKWREEHSDENREKKRKYISSHREQISAQRRAQRQAHPEWDVLHNERRRAAKAKVENTLTKAEWFDTIEYFGNVCAYCGQPMKLTQDHFVPLSLGGGLTKENTIPACQSCNSSKRAMSFTEWYRGKDFYDPEREQKILAFTGGNA